MKKTDTVIIGAGHCGLAMSRQLQRRSIDHVLLERGEIANSWRTERWDSLTLLTPNWLSRLPDYAYEGDDPDGYMDMPELIRFLDTYATRFSAPVKTHTNVTALTPNDCGYVVSTNKGDWQARAVVVASGHCNIPAIPKIASDIPSYVQTITPMHYRNPDQLLDGGVLIAGASATGVQLASEIEASGRQVILATGEHVRVPRIYRGKDIKWWMEVAGILGLPYNEVDDLRRARRVPSLQLAGLKDKSTLDLNALTDAGVEIAGRIVGVTGNKLMFSGSLRNVCALADLKMNRLLNTIDEWATENGFEGKMAPPHRLDETRVPANPRLELDLAAGNVKTIIWATGFHADLSWLKAQVFDARGRLEHDGGVMKPPGLYVLGMPYLRTRKSTLIDGANLDTDMVAKHLTAYLAGQAAER